MKRQLRGGEGESSKAKRRKEMPSSDQDVVEPLTEVERVKARLGEVREQGLKIWNTVKDATNKDGRVLSIAFLKKPPKKLYPDYYQFIQHPIALDDIKKQLESNFYPTLEAVRQDFELCFDNAKTYNRQDSEIWLDAKELHKIANKAYNKLVPEDEDTRPPSLHRLAKTRMQKLLEKTDDDGRVMSPIFTTLPDKKIWASYYVLIKRPECLDAIMKRIKKKEYHTMADFADDVELVFSNAMEFNLEGSPIWNDALSLRDYFRQLMTDLPPAFAVPRYQKPSATKIKLKMPAASTAAGPSTITAPAPSVVLRVPTAKVVTTKTKVSTPSAAPAPLPNTQSISSAPPKPTAKADTSELPPNTLPSTNMIKPSTQATAPATKPTPKPAPALSPPPYITTTFKATPTPLPVAPPVAVQVPNPVPPPALPPIMAPAPRSAAPTPAPIVPTPVPKQAMSMSNSPAPPPIPPSHMLKGVSLTIEPCKRPFLLDHRDGVKTWVMRLGPGENGIRVSDVAYMGDDDASSDDEDEEEETDAMDVDHKKKGGKSAQAASEVKRENRKITEIQVKLNGLLISEKQQQPGHWMVDLQTGSNIIEVGEKGGLVWKVYADRPV